MDAGNTQVAPLWCQMCPGDCDWCPDPDRNRQDSAGKPLVASEAVSR